jgi:hypothetical protein
MSYRNITVDGVDYKYTVGKAHVKVRCLGVWLKEDIGEVIDDMNWGDTYTVQVRPEHIAAKIRETIRLNT